MSCFNRTVDGQPMPDVSSPLTRKIQYIALPEEERQKVWNSIRPVDRYLEDQSPLAKVGWLSFWSEDHQAFIVTAHNDGSLMGSMIREADELGVSLRRLKCRP